MFRAIGGQKKEQGVFQLSASVKGDGRLVCGLNLEEIDRQFMVDHAFHEKNSEDDVKEKRQYLLHCN